MLAQLSTATQPYHADVDVGLDRLLAEPSAQRYRGWLLGQHGFLAPLEAAFDTTPRLGDAIEVRSRRKAPRLRSDLLALGVAPTDIAASPTCTAVPSTFTRPSVAFGWLYVVERSILPYHEALRRLARALPNEVTFASAHLKCYEANLGVMWRSFASALELACTRSEEKNEAIDAARDAFRCLSRWNEHTAGARALRAG